jgi:hypothetical protein
VARTISGIAAIVARKRGEIARRDFVARIDPQRPLEMRLRIGVAPELEIECAEFIPREPVPSVGADRLEQRTARVGETALRDQDLREQPAWIGIARAELRRAACERLRLVEPSLHLRDRGEVVQQAHVARREVAHALEQGARFVEAASARSSHA